MYKRFFQILKIFSSSSYKLCKNNSKQPSILYGCSDVDRYANKDGKLFSPILASIHGYFASDFVAVNITQSLSMLYSAQILNGHINLNLIYIIDFLLSKFLFFGLKSKKKGIRRTLVYIYKIILKKNKVKLIISIQPPHELCIAAHELGLKVVEPMHGMNLSTSDKIFLNQFDGFEDYLLPDCFIAFDEQTYLTLSVILKERNIQVFFMPHPWHFECLKSESPLIDKRQLNSFINLNYDKVILLSLQWGYDGERAILENIIPNGILHDSIIDIIKKHKNIFWLIRLHPVQLKGTFYVRHRKYVADICERYKNTEFKVASTAPLPILLRLADGHLTMSSGSAGEAALMNIPSMMLCPTLREGGALSGSFVNPSTKNLITFSEPTSSSIYNWICSLNKSPFSCSDEFLTSRRIKEVLENVVKNLKKVDA